MREDPNTPMRAGARRLDDGRVLHLVRAVRRLPGKREVWRGELEGRPVFAKFYLDAGRGKTHWQRELDGLAAFRERGIPTAELAYAGELEGGGWPVIVLAQLPQPLSLKEAWDQGDAASRERLLREMTALLARHHRAGICQTDLHLGNFVVSNHEIHSLDGDGVRAVKGELAQEASLDNLALFLAQLPPEWASRAPALYDLYLTGRGWARGPGGGDLRRRVEQRREKRWEERRRKLLRECTAFVCRKTAERLEVIARADAGPDLDALLADPDASFPGKDQALKNGNTCTVWAAQAGGLRLVIKRYNVKGLWHGIKLSTRAGRAFISWENAHRLLFHGIATPRPVAVVKIRRGPLRPVAYFLAEEVKGIGAHHWFRDAGISGGEKTRMADRIAGLFRQLEDQRISHGDMKASNILIVGNEPMLIDLDAMQRHSTEASFKKAWERDLRRFMRNWDDEPELQTLFSGLLQSAL